MRSSFFESPQVIVVDASAGSGKTYALVLSAPAKAQYEAFPMRKGTDKGFSDATVFADGHAEFHRWVNPETVQPIQPNVLYCPVAVTSSGEDFQWVVSHMSIPTTTVGPTTANPDPNPSY